MYVDVEAIRWCQESCLITFYLMYWGRVSGWTQQRSPSLLRASRISTSRMLELLHPVAFMQFPLIQILVLTLALQALYPLRHHSRPSLCDFLVAKKPRTFLELIFISTYANYTQFFFIDRFLSISPFGTEKKCINTTVSACSAWESPGNCFLLYNFLYYLNPLQTSCSSLVCVCVSVHRCVWMFVYTCW